MMKLATSLQCLCMHACIQPAPGRFLPGLPSSWPCLLPVVRYGEMVSAMPGWSGELREGLPPDSPRPRGGTPRLHGSMGLQPRQGLRAPAGHGTRDSALRSPGRRQEAGRLGESDRSKAPYFF